VQYASRRNLFHTPGVFYRPASLKALTVLWGDKETRTVYDTCQLDNLHINTFDPTHANYEHYLQNKKFLLPGEKRYFAHTIYNVLPQNEVGDDDEKGSFNLFPVDLEPLHSVSPPTGRSLTNLGVVANSPLKLELEFEPVPTLTWFLTFTFVYMNKINFPGQKNKQDITYDYLM